MRRKFASLALALVLALSLVPAASAAPAGIAKASTQSVEVDGQSIQFQMYALESDGGLTNYVKLRDVAHVLSGTPAKFSVGYDGIISITTGADYTDNGSEMTTPYSGDRAYQPGPGSVKVNGADVTLDAIVLTDDSGGAYTYFKLRDLGTALGFKVDWSGERGVFIETGGETVNSGEVTLADLQGVWHLVSVPEGWTPCEADIVISGDQYINAIIQEGLVYEQFLYEGTISELKKDFLDQQANSICAYAVIWSGTKQVLFPDGEISPTVQITGTAEALKIIELDLEKGYFVDLNRRRYEKVSEPMIKNTVVAAFKAAETAKTEQETAISKYPTYADFPGVPDFGAIYGLRVKEQRLAWGSTKVTICAYDYDEAEELACELFGDGDVKYYEIYDMVEKLKEDYYRILEECGYEESLQRNTFGDLLMVHKNDELGYRVDVYISLFGDGEFQIYIQPLR